MQIDYAVFGRRIAAIRKKRGLTQEKLAERADVTNNFISHIETCQIGRASCRERVSVKV